MQRAEPKFCGGYQARRRVQGRPECPYTRRACPFGEHACESCGRGGHGSQDCLYFPPGPATMPPPAAALVPPAPPPVPPPAHLLPRTASSQFLSVACTSKAGSYMWPGTACALASTRAPASSLPSSASTSATAPVQPPPNAVYVQGFGCKGEGKDANYGTRIPPPSIVFGGELDQLPGAAWSHCGTVKEEPGACLSLSACPHPIAASPDEVERWIAETFKPLTSISTKMPPEIGESVLWRGVKTGASGAPATKCEWFIGDHRASSQGLVRLRAVQDSCMGWSSVVSVLGWLWAGVSAGE